MNEYKLKVLLTLAALTLIFGFIAVQNYAIWVEQDSTTDIPLELPVSPSNDRWDIPEYIPLDQKEAACKVDPACNKLAQVVVYEARGESLQGQYAVASVVLNRVDSKRFPNTIWGVVHQKHQFEYLVNMHKQSKPSQKDWTRARIVAYNLLHGEMERITDADHYLNPHVVGFNRLPRWVKVFDRVLVVGYHHFYKS